jgi:hypothetical protein
MIVTLFSLIALTASAQHSTSDTLYWVVETNTNNPSYSVVRFYDQRNFLVHEVRLDGAYINVRIPKHRKKLDQLLKGYMDRTIATSKKNKSKRSI